MRLQVIGAFFKVCEMTKKKVLKIKDLYLKNRSYSNLKWNLLCKFGAI